MCAAGRAAADAASRQGLPRARSLQSQRPQTNADEPSFFRLSDGSPAQWRTVMLATLRQLSRTFSNPSSVITVENLDREDSIKNWRQNSSVEREEEEVGGEPTPKAPLKLSRSRSLKMALPAKGLDSRSGLGRATACGLEGGAIPGGLEETSAIGGGRFAREMAGGLERALGGGSVSGEEGREGASKGAAQGMVHVEHAQGAVAQIAPPNVRNLCSEEKAWRQLEADQTQNLGPRMTEVYQPSFGPVLNPAPEASEARQAQSAVWSAAQGQGLRFMERHDFGMPSRLDHLPRKGAISGKRAVEAAQGYLVGRRPQESLEGRFPQEYSEGKRPQEFLEGERPQDSLDRRRLQEYLIEGKRPQVYSEGKRPQAEPMRERTASGVEQSHDADSNLERTADVWESVREPVMESVRESVRESVHAKAGMRLHLAPPRLQHAQSVDSFFAHSETEPYARGAAGPSEEVHNPRGLYSGGPARAHYRLGRASLGVEDQSLVFAESYRSEEPIHTYQPALGRGSRPQAKRRSQPETGRRAPPARFDLPRPGSLPREAARSLPLSTGDMYQRDQFPGGLEVALHVQEGAAGLDRNISGHGALGNRFSVPPPLSLEEEMRSVRGGKRLLETPREGEKDIRGSCERPAGVSFSASCVVVGVFTEIVRGRTFEWKVWSSAVDSEALISSDGALQHRKHARLVFWPGMIGNRIGNLE